MFREAALLADVIINGSAEELALSKLQRKVEEEVLKVQVQEREAGRSITAEDASVRACENLRAGGLTSVQMETDGHMAYANRVCWGPASEKRSLASVKQELSKVVSSVPGAGSAGYGGVLRGGRGRGGRGGEAFSVPAPWAAMPATMPPMPVSAPATAASTNLLKEDLISSAQVSRMVQKAKCQNRLF